MSDKIKSFFAKKKAEAKFKLGMAGGGQRLGAAAAASSSGGGGSGGQPRASGSGGDASSSQLQRRRQEQTAQQRNAAAAAVARMDVQETDDDFAKKRSIAAIKAQARKEIEREKQGNDAECDKLRSTSHGAAEVREQKTSPLCPGVFFTCPLVGPEVLPKKEMQARIKQFLHEQMEAEPDSKGLTAALVIYTCIRDQEKVRVCVETLCKYLDNIITNPTEEKYRKIRQGNKAYVERVAGVEGSDRFLEAAGFQHEVIDGEAFWVLPALDLDAHLSELPVLKDALLCAEPIRPELDRSVRVLWPEQAATPMTLPTDFFAITPDEIKRMQQAKTDSVERESLLRTAAMREREAANERRKYKYTLIRVRFPDGFVLQGTFSVYEKFPLLASFVSESLSIPLPFVLNGEGGRRRLDAEDQRSLLDLDLVPTAKLAFAWHPDVAEDVAAAASIANQTPTFLKPELMALATKD